MNYGYGIEQLDYTVHLTMGDHEECVRFFAEHPVFGTVGYASYEDAEDDLHGFLGVGQFLDICESMVNAGYDGDHFYFNRQEMLVEVRCDYWGWTWTPETGIIYDPEPEPATFSKPSRQERRNNKKASRRKGSAKRFRDRSRKWQSENHIYDVYRRGLCGDYAIRGRRLAETGRPQRVNVHFTNGIPQDVYNLTETDVYEQYSISTWNGYESMEDFFQYMDNMDWGRIPKEVHFFTEANTIDPFGERWYEPEYFAMNATLKRGGVSAEKAKEEYLKFKKRYQVFHKYAKKLRTLHEEMRAELRA